MSTINTSANITSSGDFGVTASNRVTTTGDALDYRRIDATTTEVEHTISASVGDVGIALVKNLDSTNFVDVGFATTVYPIRLLAGQFALMPLTPATASLFVKADTATCEIDIYIREA